MQSAVHLKVDVSPTVVATGVATEVALRVTNTSAVPLFQVRFRAEHGDGTVDADEIVLLGRRTRLTRFRLSSILGRRPNRFRSR